jgi:predicted MPP superfamily phosphohydrolase
MPLMTRYDNFLVNAYYNVTWAWFGFLLFLSCAMLVFEIVNLMHKLPPVPAGWTVIAVAAILAGYSLFNAATFKTAEIAIPIKNLADEVRIVQISDIHLGASRSGRYLEKIVEKTNELKPDLVVITGDVADSKAALRKNIFSPLKGVQSPVYFVYGNHDVYVGLDEIIGELEENNVIVLQNEALATQGILLVGLKYMKADDSVHDPHQVTDETIKDTLPTLDLKGDLPIIVLHHGPWGIEYMSQHGVDLVLAGHTHGGQLFPVSLLASAAFPIVKGLAKHDGTYMLVSQGVGTYLPRMRLGTGNEINLVTLKPLEE